MNHNELDIRVIDCIPKLITSEDNQMLIITSEEDEIKHVVFNMSIDSFAGPDDYNGKFFQSCWTIIKNNIIGFVHDFFRGKILMKFYSHVCLALILKLDSPITFNDLRSISLK